MNGDSGHLARLSYDVSTVRDEANLPKRTEDQESHSVDMNTNDEGFFDRNKRVEVVSDSLSVHCGHPDDAVPIMNNQIEQSDSDAGMSNDAVTDYNDGYDVTQHIDSVFFACDPAGTGAVAVSDIIDYLSDTLHVSMASIYT